MPAYLAAFGPALRERLGREAEEKGREAFAGSLRAAARARKSHAVFAPEADGPDAARVVVESVYPDRNERQTYRLERSEGGWRDRRRRDRPGPPARRSSSGPRPPSASPRACPCPSEIPTTGEEPPME